MRRDFELIDKIISEFVSDNDLAVRINTRDQYFAYKNRRIYWTDSNVNYEIEIFPAVLKEGNIDCWIIDSNASCVNLEIRFELSEIVMKDVALNKLIKIFNEKLVSTYEQLKLIKEDEIIARNE